MGTIALLGRQKPNCSSQMEVVQRAKDLADGFGADMGMDLGGLNLSRGSQR